MSRWVGKKGSEAKQLQVKQLEHEWKINVNEKSFRREKRFAESWLLRNVKQIEITSDMKISNIKASQASVWSFIFIFIISSRNWKYGKQSGDCRRSDIRPGV